MPLYKNAKVFAVFGFVGYKLHRSMLIGGCAKAKELGCKVVVVVVS